MSERLRRFLALRVSLFYQAAGYGGCARCRLSVRFADRFHRTEWSPSSGMYLLCEYCWRQLGTAEHRLPYYQQMVFSRWSDTSKWPLIRAAVLAESATTTVARRDTMTSRHADFAAAALREIRRAFPPGQDENARNFLKLTEETGEAIGAFNRWAGMSRRVGSFANVGAELADVVLTAYVAAASLGIEMAEIHGKTPNPDSGPVDPADSLSYFLDLGEATGSAVCAFRRWPSFRMSLSEVHTALARVVLAAYVAARSAGIDLDAACEAKAGVITGRAWREAPRV